MYRFRSQTLRDIDAILLGQEREIQALRTEVTRLRQENTDLVMRVVRQVDEHALTTLNATIAGAMLAKPEDAGLRSLGRALMADRGKGGDTAE